MADRRLEPLADVLNRVVRTLDIERELLTHAAGPAWDRTVGERLARHTRATQLQGGVLTVEARSAAWLNEVSLLRDDICTRLNVELRGPAVRHVRFRLGGGFPPLDADRAIDPPTDDEVRRAEAELATEGEQGAQLAARAYALSRKK